MVILTLCCLLEPLSARKDPSPAQRARKDRNRGADFHRVAVVYRAGISDYRAALRAFKKKVGHEVAEIVLSDSQPVSALRRKLVDLEPQMVLTVGDRAAESLFKALPRRARRSLAVIRIMLSARAAQRSREQRTGSSVRDLTLAARPSSSLQALIRIRPSVDRVFVLNEAPSDPWLKSVERHGKKKGIRVHRLDATDPRKLVSRLAALQWRPKDGILVPPQPSLVNSLVLNALLRVQLCCRVPVVSFSRRHVRAGIALARQRLPVHAGRAAARLAKEILGTRGQRRGRGSRARRRARRRAARRRHSFASEKLEASWWYNGSTTAHLGIDSRAIQDLGGRPVEPPARDLAERTRPQPAHSPNEDEQKDPRKGERDRSATADKERR
jgi:hypothetical protein